MSKWDYGYSDTYTDKWYKCKAVRVIETGETLVDTMGDFTHCDIVRQLKNHSECICNTPKYERGIINWDGKYYSIEELNHKINEYEKLNLDLLPEKINFSNPPKPKSMLAYFHEQI